MNRNDHNENTKAQIASLKQIFNSYYAMLCFFAERLIEDRIEAEDIVQDVFIKLWEKQSDFAQYTNIKAVLFIAVKNACLNYKQKQSVSFKRASSLAYATSSHTGNFVLLEMVRAEVLNELYQELAKLPTECRNVMRLLFVEGWDPNKTAEHLNLRASTVRTQKSRGIQALRKKINLSIFLLFMYFFL